MSRTPFVEKTLRSLLLAAEYAASAETLAASGGALQAVDPRVKAGGLLLLIAVAVAARNPMSLALLFAGAVLLGLLSRITPARLALRVWLPVLFFSGAVALPALFLTPGTALAGGVTDNGALTAARLLGRAETSATLAALLVFTTPWPKVLRALRALGAPAAAVMILGMTYRYIFVMLQAALEMLESRRSRTVGVLLPADGRRLATASAGVLLSRSLRLSGDIHLAMQARGYRGEVQLLDEFQTRPSDWVWLAGFALLAAGALLVGWPR